MIIPWQDISPSALDNLVENSVLHEGIDYDEHEHSLEQKVVDVRHQLQSGEAMLVWPELHETVNIMPRKRVHE